jgi:hypothetical protein
LKRLRVDLKNGDWQATLLLALRSLDRSLPPALVSVTLDSLAHGQNPSPPLNKTAQLFLLI